MKTRSMKSRRTANVANILAFPKQSHAPSQNNMQHSLPVDMMQGGHTAANVNYALSPLPLPQNKVLPQTAPQTDAHGLTAKMQRFFLALRQEGLSLDEPVLVVDSDIVAYNYASFARALPQTHIYYAVKANPASEILRLLARLGSSFDAASVAEIQMVLAAGAPVSRISFGNTIKKEKDIARALALGVRLFAVDCVAEVEKISRAAGTTDVCAQEIKVFCRMLCDGAGAEWPLSRKFGCVPEMAPDVLAAAHHAGLTAYGLSFHVGSQQNNPHAWEGAVASAASVFQMCARRGFSLQLLNLGGGFPTRYLKDIPAVSRYGAAITDVLKRYFGDNMPQTIIEPGRGMVGNAGVIESEVVLISRKSEDDPVRWVYLDIGKFGGLAETMDESIRYPLHTLHDGASVSPCVLAGPTCDSADVLYEKTPYNLPDTLEIGDKVWIEGTGAYTTTYSAVAFNGFNPLKSYVI
jgi:ornithine decarboxylase